MRLIKSLTFFFLIGFLATGCKIEYRPSVESPSSGYLVVEGFINTGSEPTQITLSRTIKLYDDSTMDTHEHNALVNIEGENNESYPLYETGDGVYTCLSPQLNINEKYRLKIKTSNGKEYASDFSSYRSTPDIDSLSWQRNGDGVKIYINTHQDGRQTGYYSWKYEETWEFHSRYLSSLKWVYNDIHFPVAVTYKYPDQSYDTTIYKCWKSFNSSNIIVGATEKLSSNHIYFPIMDIEPASEKISVLYSITVSQYALSQKAYYYLEKLKKNTEEIGSIFAGQPSQLTGNIHCTTDPSEIVIGYIEASQEKQKRLYIKNSELPGWGFETPCTTTIIKNDPDDIRQSPLGLPTIPFQVGNGIMSFYKSDDINCVDCTRRGSNVKPSFWP